MTDDTDGLRDRLAKQSEDALGKIAQELLDLGDEAVAALGIEAGGERRPGFGLQAVHVGEEGLVLGHGPIDSSLELVGHLGQLGGVDGYLQDLGGLVEEEIGRAHV